MKAFFRSLLAAVILVGAALDASAVGAWPYPIDVTQPDGSRIRITMHGDEFFSWATSDGKVVKKDTDGFYRECAFDYAGQERGRIMRAEATRPMTRIPYAAQMSSASPSGKMTLGEKHFLVILIEFSDLAFTVDSPQQAFSDLLNQKGYSANGGTGSARDYFMDQSNGRFKPTFDVVGPVKVGQSASYYGKDKGMVQNTGAPRLLQDACSILDRQGFDFSQYDLDNNGYIDNIFFYYAGYNQAEGNPDTIWPHKWQVNSAPYFDGKHLWTYACTSEYRGYKTSKEMCSIGTFCHEFSHVLGLPDLYDVNGEDDGDGPTPGIYSIMSSGNYNNRGRTPPYYSMEERAMLGWIGGTDGIAIHDLIMEGWKRIPELPKANGNYILKPVYEEEGYTCPTDNENEYFIFEYRDGTGWDSYIESGVLIYHVDKSENMAGQSSAYLRWTNYGFDGCINDVGDHPCYWLLPAEGDSESYKAPFGNSVFRFTANSKPSAKSWSGTPTWYNLSNIRHDGQKATLTLRYEAPGTPFAVCAIDLGDCSWRDGDILPLRLMESGYKPQQTDWYYDGEQLSSDKVTLTSGTHSLEARLTFSDGRHGSYRTQLNVD